MISGELAFPAGGLTVNRRLASKQHTTVRRSIRLGSSIRWNRGGGVGSRVKRWHDGPCKRHIVFAHTVQYS